MSYSDCTKISDALSRRPPSEWALDTEFSIQEDFEGESVEEMVDWAIETFTRYRRPGVRPLSIWIKDEGSFEEGPEGELSFALSVRTALQMGFPDEALLECFLMWTPSIPEVYEAARRGFVARLREWRSELEG